MTPIGSYLKKEHKDNTPVKIIFRCDASQAIGVGHVMRCLVLADALVEQGAECVFATIEESKQAVPVLEESGYSLIFPDQLQDENPDFIVIDHYDLGDDFFQMIQDRGIPCLIIDDLHNKEFYSCDMLLVNNFIYSNNDYQDLVSKDCQIFSGPEFLLIRPEFLNFDRKKYKRNVPVNNLFLFFGGTDPAHLTLRLLTIIQSHKIEIPHIDVVIGSINQDRQKIEKICQSLNATLYVQADNMAEIMKKSDLAVGCGGTAIWERLSLNVPTLEMSHFDEQVPTLQDLDAKGYVKYLGDAGELSDSAIAERLSKALENDLNLRYCPCGGEVKTLAAAILKQAG